MTAVAELHDVRVTFPGAARPALDGLTLRLDQGDLVAVVGPAGAGKSTLARLLAGLIPGHLAATVEGVVRRPDVVGYVPERAEAALIEPRVADDVGLGVSADERAARVAGALTAVGLAGFERRLTGELSGGEIQRVAVAGALARRATLLVLDDPTSELDAEGREALLSALAGTTAVIATHDPAVVARCTRAVALDTGAAAYDGPPAALLADPALCRRLGLRTPHDAPVRARVGAPQPGPPAGVVARAEGLGFAYPGSPPVLDRVDLDLRGGEIVALRGANGAGKTTLGLCLLGLLGPITGRVQVEGAAAMVMQDPDVQLFHETVRAEVSYAPRCQDLPAAEVAARVERALDDLGLTRDADLHPLRLTRSRRQLVAVAAALAAAPSLLVLDEPTAGLDRDSFERVVRATARAAEQGTAVLLITHDDDLAALATRSVELPAPAPPSAPRDEPPAPPRGDVRVVGVAALAAMVALVVLGSWPALTGVVAVGLALLAMTRGGLRRLGATLLPLAPVALLVGIFGFLWPPAWVADPAAHALALVLRLVGMVTWTVWALAAADVERGIAWARSSRLPPSLVLVLTIALRFVPTLSRRRERIRTAQRARGVPADAGGPVRRARAAMGALVPLFVGAIATSDDLAAALAVRGVAPHPRRGRARVASAE
ncbi:MAG: ATP-binding cassette domain-containing protein [Arachnia sp.]